MNKPKDLKLKEKNLTFSSKPQYKIAYGVTSECMDGSHIYMGDIDKDISIHRVRGICLGIQREYHLSTLFIVSSTHGYNMYSLDKLPLKLIFLINNTRKDIDPVFNRLAFKNRGCYVLRTLPASDKMVCDIVHKDNRLFVQSNAHRIYFNNMFGLNVQHNHCFDNNEIVKICRFKNKKYGWVSDESE